MRTSRTHFEQIPLEVVKKIAEGSVSKDQKTSTDNVIPVRSPRSASSGRCQHGRSREKAAETSRPSDTADARTDTSAGLS